MKILDVKSLAIPEIKVIRFARFCDTRGYFSESFRKSEVLQSPETSFLHDVDFVQTIESFSNKNTIRGLHFQWNPFMGKLVRTLHGRMVDLILDIRKGSPTLGKLIAYEMPYEPNADYSEWIWIPPGFAHGNYFTSESSIEYFCSGEYSPGCEAAITPLSKDIDWSECDPFLMKDFANILDKAIISDKDKRGYTLSQWLEDERSNNFVYPKAKVKVGK